MLDLPCPQQSWQALKLRLKDQDHLGTVQLGQDHGIVSQNWLHTWHALPVVVPPGMVHVEGISSPHAPQLQLWYPERIGPESQRCPPETPIYKRMQHLRMLLNISAFVLGTGSTQQILVDQIAI